MMLNRRHLIASLVFVPISAMAIPDETLAVMQKFTGGKPTKEGLIKIAMNELVDNGNSVSIRVSVNHPQTVERYITRIGLFNEKNPQADIAIFTLSVLSGKAEIATRIRLATSQRIHALCETSDGLFYHDSFETIVTLAACLEE